MLILQDRKRFKEMKKNQTLPMKCIKLQKPYFILLKPANFQRFSRPEGILHNLCAIPDKRAQKTTFTRGQSQLLQAFVVRFYLAAFI